MMEETWETVQIKTFTNWANAKLEKGKEKYMDTPPREEYFFTPIQDLTTDLRDGTLLLSLLYSITGLVLKYNKKPRFVMHRRENIEKVIGYLKGREIEMVNIGAADIEEGSRKLTLALIWRLILMSTIYDLQDAISGKGFHVQEEILSWCQERTKGYDKVNIKDFTKSWRDGLGMSALVHSELQNFVYDEGEPEEIATRAFRLAHKHLKVPILISGKDLISGVCDDKSIITYLIGLYTEIKRTEKEKQKQAERDVFEQEVLDVSALKEKIVGAILPDRADVESLEGAKKELDAVYKRVREAEQRRVANTARYVLDMDYIARRGNFYGVYSLEEEMGANLEFAFQGLFDSSSVLDSLKRWGLPGNGEESGSGMVSVSVMGVAESAYAKCTSNLLSLPKVITYTAAFSLIKQTFEMAEETLQGIEESRSLGGVRGTSSASLCREEKEKSAEGFLRAIAKELGRAAERFPQKFALDLEKEEELVQKYAEAQGAEINALSDACIPAGSEQDLLAFQKEGAYKYVVSESMVYKREGETQEFMPISISQSK
ncbi:hypothetical protein NECID01_1775 [Nematocida sp. AWRm77]|nr:hypothetical protein NECID01_1775 [Nematocida sp. AWRm77]